jgi:hypothetical protein
MLNTTTGKLKLMHERNLVNKIFSEEPMPLNLPPYILFFFFWSMGG